MWKNIVERGRPQMTVWRMRIACWIPKATDAHTECVILIAFPRQDGHASLSRRYVHGIFPFPMSYDAQAWSMLEYCGEC